MTDDFRPTASMEVLKQRARTLAAIRQFFDQRDFFEVQTPLLSRDTVVDRHIDPLGIDGSQLGVAESAGNSYWLQTSPEFAMKRLLAAGAEAIYQICPAFRASESGRMHNPEFTMLEWYRVGDDMRAGMQLLSDLVESVLSAGASECVSYRSAFQRFAEVDVLDASVEELAAVAKRFDLDTDAFEGCRDVDDWRNWLLTQIVEPQLGKDQPQIVFDWPASQSALAKVRAEEDPPVAERFELYYRGVELANGYHELVDANELLQRNVENNQLRVADGKHELPAESRLLDAMRHGLPACSGVAMGVDRLVMLAAGCKDIEQVLAFPISIA